MPRMGRGHANEEGLDVIEKTGSALFFFFSSHGFRVCQRTTLSPGWGSLFSHFLTHGLRRGLRSYAASRLRPGAHATA